MRFLFCLLSSTVACAMILTGSVRAQAPSISSVQMNEHLGQISIYGTFGSTKPTVTVDSTSLKVLAYSDTLIRCTIPATGTGSAGDVRVITENGTSNTHRISAISLKVYYDFGGYSTRPLHSGAGLAQLIYPLSFRGDLSMIWSKGYNLDPVGDSITGHFGANMSSYDTSNHQQSNIHLYSAQGSISAYPVPVANQNSNNVPVYALLDYRDSSLRISVGRINYYGQYTAQYMATSQSQPTMSAGQVNGSASSFVLHYKILPDFSFKLVGIDSDKYFYVDPEIGTPTSTESSFSIDGPRLDPAPVAPQASVRVSPPSGNAILYPNPARGMVYASVPYSRIELFDALGRSVLSSRSTPLDVNKLDDGLYFYQIEKDHTVINGTLIVRK